jgi:hypothetical protein
LPKLSSQLPGGFYISPEQLTDTVVLNNL